MTKFATPKFNIAAKPNICSIEQFRKFVTQKVGDVANIKPPDYESRYRKYYYQIIAVWNKEQSLTTLPAKIFKKIPVIAVISFDGEPKLIDNDMFRQAWLALIGERNDSRQARKIYRAVLRNYYSYQPHLEHVFVYIKPLIRNASQPLCKKLTALDNRYDLISPLIIKNITAYILQHANESIDDILLDMGIAGALREADISAAVGNEILAQNYSCLSNNDDSMLAITLAYFSNDTENTLRLEYLRNDILKSLLENYIHQDPPAKIKKAIEGFTNNYLGDPRANPRWRGVKDEIVQVVVRWKVGVTLEAFFALLDHVAHTDSTHDRHWQARKEFWQGYLDRGKITAAWVVLGKTYLNDRKFLNADNLKFGEFSAQVGIKRSHCAIIMQISGHTITEWSHVGALRIWEGDDKRAPQLYQDIYHPDDLRNLKTHEDGYIPHHINWQQRAQDILESETTFRRW